MNSKFLPSNYNGEPITLVAGQGGYPLILTKKIKSLGIQLKLISIIGETENHLLNLFEAENIERIQLGKLNQLLKAIKSHNAKYIILAGQVNPRKLFNGLNPDFKTVKLLLGAHNAETIFGGIIREIEGIGYNVIDSRSFLDEHLATKGLMSLTNSKPEWEYINYGIEVTKKVAGLNIGQGIVISKKTIIAVEAYEGTNKMLERAGQFGAKDLIFIKTIKQDQDYRFDVPVFGEKTLEIMEKSKIKTAALQSDSVLILDKKNVIQLSERHKIQLIGY